MATRRVPAPEGPQPRGAPAPQPPPAVPPDAPPTLRPGAPQDAGLCGPAAALPPGARRRLLARAAAQGQRTEPGARRVPGPLLQHGDPAHGGVRPGHGGGGGGGPGHAHGGHAHSVHLLPTPGKQQQPEPPRPAGRGSVPGRDGAAVQT